MHKLEISAEELKQLYATDGLSSEETAYRLGVSRRTVTRRCLEFGIRLRSRGSGHHPLRKDGTYTDVNGYVFVRRPGHPRAMANGYMMRAIDEWEKANGRPFPEGKHPHHDNEMTGDDRPENIIPMTHSEHLKEHERRARCTNATGHDTVRGQTTAE